LRIEIIQLYYDIPVARHEERWKTTELMIMNYWRPVVIKDIGKYVNMCDRY